LELKNEEVTLVNIAKMIDHTVLKPEATSEMVEKVCTEAKAFGFASVCINPVYVGLAANLLLGSNVKVCTVIGFPLGANSSIVKALEARDAVACGAQELDMVINIGALKNGNDSLVERDIAAVVEAAGGRVVKVILETCLLTNEEKIRACKIAQKAGASFVKTSTGFNSGGATVDDISLMRRAVGPQMGVKASGGIRDLATAKAMIQAGANRLGTSSGVAIVQGKNGEHGY
jgi:deoxyribose-phosphate aldolase